MSASTPVALITGGGRNIGRAIALRLATAGYDIAVAGPETDEVQVVALEIKAAGRRGLPLLVDVSREDQVQYMVRKTKAELGSIELLVNNAGITGPTAPVARVEKRDWDEVLAVNLTGAFLCSKAVLPLMLERRSGKIINISSVAGKMPYAWRSPYAASKWGLIGLTQTLAKEVGEHNIQVNAICPGPVEGERMAAVIRQRAQELGQSEDDVAAAYKRTTLLGRFVREEDIAETVAFLASVAGDNITGQTIDVTAGYGL